MTRATHRAEVLASHPLDTVDLLKVDVEGAEESVLSGISTKDWQKVQAAVIGTGQ